MKISELILNYVKLLETVNTTCSDGLTTASVLENTFTINNIVYLSTGTSGTSTNTESNGENSIIVVGLILIVNTLIVIVRKHR